MLNFEEFLLIRFERFINSTYGTFIRNIRVVGYCWKIWKSIGITSELLPWKVYSGISFSRSDVGQGRVCASFLTKPFLQIQFFNLVFYQAVFTICININGIDFSWIFPICLLGSGSLFWGNIYPCRAIRFANCFLLLVLDPFFPVTVPFQQ